MFAFNPGRIKAELTERLDQVAVDGATRDAGGHLALFQFLFGSVCSQFGPLFCTAQ